MRPFELEEALAEQIASGDVPPGRKLSDRDLARDHDIGRLGARQALGGLAQRGLVELRSGHEAVVARAKVEHDLRGVAGFSEQMRRVGLEPTSRVLNAKVVVPQAKVAAALQLDRSARVARIERIRYGSKLPMTLEETFLPDALFPDVIGLGLTESIYTLMRECYARGPARAVERVEAVAARPYDAEVLRVPEGSPLLLLERTSYDEGGTPIEFARDRYRGDRTRFVVESQPPT